MKKAVSRVSAISAMLRGSRRPGAPQNPKSQRGIDHEVFGTQRGGEAAAGGGAADHF